MRVGDRVGPYEVVGVLGRGGMGVVYEVRHPDVPRRLALKLIDPVGADADALLRFQREGEALARVRHPGVVAVHAAGRAARGAPYLVMDVVEGGPLPTEAVAPARAARLVRDLADAVAALHQAGLVHRDLKPSNVMLASDDRPVLLDLGLARALDAQRLTATGTILGTPAYMSPEQAQGLPADARADVYGLGAVLYALLTGRPPFSADAGGAIALLYAVVDRDPPWPRALVPEVPEALDALVRRAMAKDPADRPPSAEALRDALDAFLAGRAGAPATRRAPLALVVGCGVALLLGAALVVAPSGPAPQHAGTPVEPFPALPPPPTADAEVAPPRARRVIDRPQVGADHGVWGKFAGPDHVLVHGPGARQVALWSVAPDPPVLVDVLDLPGEATPPTLVAGNRGWWAYLHSGHGIWRLRVYPERGDGALDLEERARVSTPLGLSAFAVSVERAERLALAVGRQVTVHDKIKAQTAFFGHTFDVDVVALAFVDPDLLLVAEGPGAPGLSRLETLPIEGPDAARRTFSIPGEARALTLDPGDPRRFALFAGGARDAVLVGHVDVKALTDLGGGLEAQALTFVPGRPDLLAVAGGGRVRLWDLEAGAWRPAVVSYEHTALSLDASPDGALLLAGCAEGDLHVWSIDDLAPR